jgi:drug/metabolite transporter (DMT)-like permease
MVRMMFLRRQEDEPCWIRFGEASDRPGPLRMLGIVSHWLHSTAMASTKAIGHVTRGIGLRVATALCFALMGALLKLASNRGAGIIELILYRSLFGLPVVLLWTLAGPGLRSLAVRSIGAHAWRGSIGLASMFCTFGALILLPLAEATTLLFMGPIFATFLSWLLLSERVGRHRLLAGLAALAGVVVVMRPGASAEAIAPLGVAVGLAAALGQAGVTVTVRHLGGSENVAAIVFWFLTACTLVGLLLLPFFGTSPDRTTIFILAAAGLSGGLGQICMTGSLQDAPISVLAPFDYLHLVAAMLLGWLLLDTQPTIYTYAGATLIAGSGLYTLLREHRLRRDFAVAATPPVG